MLCVKFFFIIYLFYGLYELRGGLKDGLPESANCQIC